MNEFIFNFPNPKTNIIFMILICWKLADETQVCSEKTRQFFVNELSLHKVAEVGKNWFN